jgi:hypothetical protein
MKIGGKIWSQQFGNWKLIDVPVFVSSGGTMMNQPAPSSTRWQPISSAEKFLRRRGMRYVKALKRARRSKRSARRVEPWRGWRRGR